MTQRMPLRLRIKLRITGLRSTAAVKLAPWLLEQPVVIVQQVAVPVHRLCECEQRIAAAIADH